ncbi:very-long-chain 3-oxoacyl-CoA reductase 1-like [Wolffia australiana]
MELPILETLRFLSFWRLALLSIGLFQFCRTIYFFSRWVYVYFIRSPKCLLHYGKWAIVTGAAKGIGKAVAVEMARKGLNLVLVDRELELLKEVASEIKAEEPRVEILTVDFDLNGDIGDGVRRLGMAIEGLDVGVLVNNAGVSYRVPMFLHEVGEEMFRELEKVNLTSLTEITQLVLGMMVKKKKGAIVNLGSGSASVTPSYPMFAVYTATKGYVDQLSRCLHVEYKNFGIDIQCQVPLFVVTEMVPDKKENFFNPMPEQYAPPVLRAIGYGCSVIPYWRQSFQNYLSTFCLVPIFNENLLYAALRRRAYYPVD